MIHSPNTPPAPLHKVGMRFFKNGCNGGAGVGVGGDGRCLLEMEKMGKWGWDFGFVMVGWENLKSL